jgi:serine protease Do
LNRFSQLAEQNSPAVVNISTRQKPKGTEGFLPDSKEWNELFKEFSGEGDGEQENNQPTSLGSGFIISSDGYILTNNHVVEDAEQITVRLSTREEYEAKLIGTDKRSDVALLKIDARNLPTVKIGRSRDLKVGEWVMAIGSPFGFDHSVSVGVVSAVGRALPTETYVPFIQTDVAINPGNSGGPLFNTKGEVVGINSQIYSQSGGYMGLSFAIPIDIAMEVYKQLKAKGKVIRGWLGVYIQEIDSKTAKEKGLPRPQGALVTRVLPNSPAKKGGIKVGDVIVIYNGTSIKYSSDLPPLVGITPVGRPVKVKVYRNGKPVWLKITIQALPESELQADASEAMNDMGMGVADLSASQKKQLGIDRGVIVTVVDKRGPAKDAGIKKGDVIQAINRKSVKNKEDYDDVVSNLPKGKAILVKVVRGDEVLYLSLRLPK